MLKRKISFWSLLFIVCGLLSCERKEPNNVNPVNNTKNVETFFENNRSERQSFTVDASSNTTITADRGTTVFIPANVFVTSSGVPVTGNVTIEVQEIFNKSEMILSDRPTVSNGQILISGGELFIGASQGGEQLELKDNATLSVQTPTDSINSNMQLFTGADSSGQFNLTPVPTNTTPNTNDTSFYFDTTFPYNYMYGINQLGWINCDYFWNNSNPKTTVTIGFTNMPSDPVAVFLVFKNINSVMRVYPWGIGGSYSSSGVPEGSEVTVVAISVSGNKKYLAKQDIIVTTDHVATVTLSEVSDAQLESELTLLD